jgi:hypothetical protein
MLAVLLSKQSTNSLLLSSVSEPAMVGISEETTLSTFCSFSFRAHISSTNLVLEVRSLLIYCCSQVSRALSSLDGMSTLYCRKNSSN